MRRRIRRLVPVVLLSLALAPAAGAWTWPVQGPVLESFSFDRAHPYAAGQHRGIAIGAEPGTPVVAPAGGAVSVAGTVPASGKAVTIETPGGLSVTLTHLGSIAVTRDATIEEGAVVGTVGPSGTAELTAPYVHLGIRESANEQGYLDPLSFLPVASTPVAPPPRPAPAPAPPQAAPAVNAPAVPSTAVTNPAAPVPAAPPAAAPSPQPAPVQSAPVQPAPVQPAPVAAPAVAASPEPAGSAPAVGVPVSAGPAASPTPGTPPGEPLAVASPSGLEVRRQAPAPAAPAGRSGSPRVVASPQPGPSAPHLRDAA